MMIPSMTEVRHDASRRSTILGGVALAAGARRPARAQLTIDMTQPSFEPVPIAIVDFQGDPIGAQMATVIRNDLQNSGLFRSIPPGSFIQQNLDASAQPRFPDWRQRRRGRRGGRLGRQCPAATSRSTSACGT